MYEKLLNYALKQPSPIDFIKNCRLDRIFVNETNILDEESISKSKEKISFQKMKNEVMRAEIINISKNFQERNLFVLHFKGVTLADDIYPEEPEIRNAGDIDILVTFDELEESLNLMGELGYYIPITHEPVSFVSMRKFSHQVLQDRVHFPEFEKKFILPEGEMSIQLDFHVSIIHNHEKKIEIMNEIINRCKTQEYGDGTIKIFDLHDRILHLIAHITKEYFRNYIRWYVAADRNLNNQNAGFPLNLLHDIALLLDKYDISYNRLLSYAKLLNMVDELLLIYKILNVIYLDLIPETAIKTLALEDLNTKDYRYKRSSMFYLLPISLKLDPQLLVSKSIVEVASIIMNEHLELEKKIRILCEEQYFSIIKREEDDFVQGTKIIDKTYNTFSELNISYTLDELLLEVKLPTGYDLTYQPLDLLFAFFKYNDFIKGYIAQIRCLLVDGKINLSINNIHIKLDYKNKNNFIENEGKILMKIPWNLLGVIPCKGFRFMFDLEFTSLLKNNLKQLNSHNKIMIDEISLLKDRHTYLYSPEIFNEITLG